ncbi:hypothetical protein Tco_0698496 [Tanacetum coccineum]
MGRDTIQLETAVSTISLEYLLEFTSEYGISEDLHPELPGPEERIVDFLKGKVGVYTKFFEFANFRLPISQFLLDILGHYQIHLSQLSVIGAAKVDERVFPTVVDWRINAPKDEMPVKGLSQRYFLGDDVYPTFLNDDDQDMDLFNLISAPNPTKVRTGTRPRAAHEVPLLTATANRVIVMEDATVASGQAQDELSQETPPEEAATTTKVVQEPRLEKEGAAMGRPVNKRRRKRDNAEAKANAPPKVLRKDHAPVCPEQSTRGGKSLAAMGLGADSTFTSAAQETPADVSDPEPLSYAEPHLYSQQDIAQSSRVSTTKIPAGGVATTKVPGLFSADSPESKRSMYVPSVEGSPGAIYQPGWGVTNDCRLDTSEECQDILDHTVSLGYFSELRHLPNTEFLAQYNMKLARQVALGSQLRLRFEQEVRLLKKARAQVARRNERIQVREEEIKRSGEEVESLKVVETEVHGLRNQTKNLETLLEAEVDMKKATEAKNAELAKELESLRAKFSDLQLNNNQLSQQVSILQAQVTGEERIKAIFEEFKKYEDDKVEKHCAEMDARLDALSIDFDEELYPHMLTAIAGRRWVIGHGLRLAVMKCAESIELRRALANVVSAGIAKGMSEGLEYGVKQGEAKLDLAAIEACDPEADNKYIAALHALKDLKYPAIPDKMLHNGSVSFAPALPTSQYLYTRRSDGFLVSVPTVSPQGLAILLADAAT